jgi:hypothetical protein
MQSSTNLKIALFSEVIAGKRHKYYDITSKLYQDYKMWITGEKLDTQLRTLSTRESKEELRLRKHLTVHLLPRLIGNIIERQAEVFSDNIVNFNVQAPEEFINKINLIRGYDNLDEYWQQRFKMIYNLDPNAILVIDIDEEENPLINIHTSDNVLYYEEKGGRISNLVVRIDLNTFKYYSADTVIIATKNGTQVENKYDDYDNIIEGGYFKKIKNAKYFFNISEVYDYKEQFALKIGNKYSVDENVLVSPLEIARPDIIKYINRISEKDITELLHIFAKKIEYAEKCKEANCLNGINRITNAKCENCNGTGFEPTIKSGLDVIRIPFPDVKEDMIDLSKMEYYGRIPLDTLKSQKEEIKDTEDNIIYSVLGATTMSILQADETATKTIYRRNRERANREAYIRKYAQTYQFILEKYADLLDLSDKIEIVYYLAKINQGSLDELIAQLKEAHSASANDFTTNYYNDLIVQALTSNDREEKQKYDLLKLIDITFGLDKSIKLNILSSMPMNELRIKSSFGMYLINKLVSINEDIFNTPVEFQLKKIDELAKELLVNLQEGQIQPINFEDYGA